MTRILLLTIVLSTALTSSRLTAQMFSVGDSPQRVSNSNSFFRVGYGPVVFNYTGDASDPFGTTLLEVDASALNINLETPGVSLSLTLANKLTGLDEKTLFDFGFILSNNFTFIRGQKISAGVPIKLYSSLTNANNDRAQENFNQVNFALGGGGFINLRFAEKISFTNELTPGYGFSNSSGGFFGGSMFFVTGKSRLNFLNLIGRRTLSIGYDYNFRSFDIDEELYDFDYTSHQITIGISL